MITIPLYITLVGQHLVANIATIPLTNKTGGFMTQTKPERVQYEYSVVIEADVIDDVIHSHLSEELEGYFSSYKNNIVLKDYQFKLHKLPGEF